MADRSSWQVIQLEGGAPWGFRISDTITANQPGLIVSKVRARSKADFAGLKNNDVILFINDVPTHSMSLERASELVDSNEILRLIVTNSSAKAKTNNNLAQSTSLLNNNNISRNYSNSEQIKNTNPNLIYAQNQSQSQNSNTYNNTPRPRQDSSSSFANTVRERDSSQNSNRNVLSNPAFCRFSVAQPNEPVVQSRNITSSRNSSNKQQYSNNYSQPSNNYSQPSNIYSQPSNIYSQPSNNYSQPANNYSQPSNSYLKTSSNTHQFNSQQRSNNNNNANRNISMRRNYFSATESCGDETDMDDSVFGDNQPQKSYASITLRPALKDINYFSDTETMQSASPKAYYKVRQQKPSQSTNQYISANYEKPTNIFGNSTSGRPSQNSPSSSYNYNPPSNSTNYVNSQKNSYSLLSQPRVLSHQPQQQQHQHQPRQQQQQYQPVQSNPGGFDHRINHPYTSPQIAPYLFQVPKITDKLNLNKQPTQFNPSYQNYDSAPPKSFHLNNQENSNFINDEVEAAVDPLEEKYEAQMGSELTNTSERQLYSDSYFYNSPIYNYPSINDQKKMARVIASTLEGSDPDTSKYHKYKQKQLNRQNLEFINETQSLPHSHHYSVNDDNNLESPAQNSRHHSTFVYDENIPEIIRDSIKQAEMNDPVRMVQAPDEFKRLHYTEHTTHTEMPPQAAMSLAASLTQQGGGRGAQIFQKRKAKSEKWVIDDTNVKRTPNNPYNTYAHTVAPVTSYQLPVSAPIPTLAPMPIKHTILPQKNEFSQQNNFSDFNVKPKGWNSSENISVKPPQRAPIKLAIDQSIREGIEELHFRNESTGQESDAENQNFQETSYQPTYMQNSNQHKLDLSQWNSRNNQQSLNDSKQLQISKEGIANLKQKIFVSNTNNYSNPNRYPTNYDVSKFNDGYKPLSSIAKVKLNKLNTNTFSNSNISNYSDDDRSKNYSGQHNSRNMNIGHSNTSDDIAASDL